MTKNVFDGIINCTIFKLNAKRGIFVNRIYTNLAFGICITVMLSTTGCMTEIKNNTPSVSQTEHSSDGEDILPDTDTAVGEIGQQSSVTPEMIYEARCPYIGDAPATGMLVGHLKSYYGIGQSNTIELQTAELPYEIALHFEKKPDNIAMQKMASVLISLIEKCRAVTWDYPLDEAGNRESVYFSYWTVQSVVEDAASLSYTGMEVTSEEGFSQFLPILESIREEYPAVKRETSIEKAVSASVLLYNRDMYLYSETEGEGHLILKTEEQNEGSGDNDKEITVYALTMYGGYQFQNGNFVKNGGTGVNPVVIKLSREPDGTYFVKHYQRTKDGGDYMDSIHDMFPEDLWEQCISPSDTVRREISAQERAYAADYLKSIGREDAIIGEYSDFPHVFLTDAGFSVEASNDFLEDIKYITDPIVTHAPSWLGSVERLEGGVRYLYQLSCDPETFEIIFTRSKYLSKEPGERIIYDSVTGEFNRE